MSDYDVVIKGGTILDGTGADAFEADIGIADGVIAAVDPGPLTGVAVIEADGLVVAPGFIDLHSHADFRLPGWPQASTQLPQGVTTLLVGNCGFSPFPIADLPEMKSTTAFLEPELAEAARTGAQGLSTGLIYAPGTYSDEREVQHLVSVAGRHDMLYSTHIRNEGSALTDAIAEAIRLAENSGARLQISHLKAAGPANHGTVGAALDLIEAAAERGLDVAADVYPYAASSTTLTTRLPTWAMDGGPRGLLSRLADDDQHARLLAELRAAEASTTASADVLIADLGPGRYADATGMSLAEIAQRDGVDASEATLRVLAAHQGSVTVVLHSMSEDDVDTVLRHPRVAVASDGWVMRAEGQGRPHPRSFGTFPRVLARYVRERGVLTLAEAVRKMTSLPASRLGWRDRGVLRPGAVADVVVFDPATITDTSTYTDPWQLATGVESVLVAGKVAFADGEPTGVRAGALLRR